MVYADLYVRTSTTAAGSAALARQEQDCRDLVLARGWVPRRLHADQGRSAYAGTPRQHGLASALVAAEAGLCDVCVVWRLDRLTRRGPEVMASILGAFAAAGVRVVSVMDGYDSLADDAPVRAEVLAHAAHTEAQVLGMRVSSAHQHRKQGGAWGTGVLPYGFAYDPTSGDISQDPETAPRLRALIDRVLSGSSLIATAQFANDQGWPAPRGGLWGVTTLSGLLRNPVIAGLQPQAVLNARGGYSGRTRPMPHPVTGEAIPLGAALVAPSEWSQLQAMTAARRTGARSSPQREVLTRLIFCASCGSSTHVRGKAYTCSSVANGRPCSAPARGYLPAVHAEVQRLVVETLASLGEEDQRQLSTTVALRNDPLRACLVEALGDALRTETNPVRRDKHERRRAEILAEVQSEPLSLLVDRVGREGGFVAVQDLLVRIDLEPGVGRGYRFDPDRLRLHWRPWSAWATGTMDR